MAPQRKLIILGFIASALWALLLLVLTAATYFAAKPFPEAVSGECPLLLNQLVPPLERQLSAFHPMFQQEIIYWNDANSGEKLSMFKGKTGAMSCGTINSRARFLKSRLDRGEIAPQLRIDFAVATKTLLVPIACIWTVIMMMFGLRLVRAKSGQA